MRWFFHSMVAASTAMTSTAFAASDPGLQVFGDRQRSAARGVGGEASLLLKFGSRRIVSDSRRLNLGLGAGPMVRPANGRIVAGRLLGLQTSPRYHVRFQFGGHDVATLRTNLGLAELQRKGEMDGPRHNLSGNGVFVALGITVLAVGVTMLALNDAVDDCFVPNDGRRGC